MGMNMNQLMKQAQQMQKKMQEAQAELETKNFTATSGGGAVSATVSGKRTLTALAINPEVIDAEDAEMLQDLIIVAVNDAFAQVDAEMAKNMPQGMF
ncbi:hypothetical protein FACS189425_06190 [Clostridia bacterium]|nr:hypothetical protein FACS189425_06190 [Clostridia bacterium]